MKTSNCDFSWNGSDLGSFSSDVIISTTKKNKRTFYNIRIHDTNLVCQRKVDIDFVRLVEQIKSFFGCEPRGFHSLRIKKIRYIVWRPWTDPPQPVTNVSQCPVDLRDEVRKVLVFREVTGLGNLDKTSMVISGRKVYGIHEPSKVVSINNSVLRTCHYSSWFEEVNIKDFTRRYLGFYENNQGEYLARLREELENISPPKYFWYPRYITERLSDIVN